MPLNLKTKINKSLLAKGIRYEILFPFKQDSSKQIFKALRKDSITGVQQEVLLKIFVKEKDSYREEFESLSKISSPYCVKLFGFENFGNKKALVLEYIKGVSLFQLAENFFLNPREIQYILISIYKGLKDLNKHGLCHGDLSLDNILIDEKTHIKFIDFGKANYEQAVQGTPPFLAPEIFKGIKANFLSDLYSLGVIETLLKTPCPLSSLKDMKPEDLDSDSPLLSHDPIKRFFPYETKNKTITKKDFKLLSHKVKELVSSFESRRCPTVKNPKTKSSSLFVFTRNCLLFFILIFVGSVSSQSYLPSQGLIKIYTNEWFVVHIGKFKSYTPITFPLKTGRYSIKWKNKRYQGETKIFVSKGKSLFLNDRSFVRKENHS